MAAKDGGDSCDVDESGECGCLGGMATVVREESEGQVHNSHNGHQVGRLGVLEEHTGGGTGSNDLSPREENDLVVVEGRDRYC